MCMEHWNGSDPSNGSGFLGLTQDLGSEGAGGVGGTESAARQSVMAWSVSVIWCWKFAKPFPVAESPAPAGNSRFPWAGVWNTG